jgi:hypothetical protein
MLFRVMMTLGISLMVTSTASAQAAKSSDEQCFGFAFGTWTPALDWKQAGHGAPVDTSHVPHAPNGFGWAVDANDAGLDSSLIVFPSWWPAGVVITLSRKPSTPADTVLGGAVAMVADGRKTPPHAQVRAWQKSCHH